MYNENRDRFLPPTMIIHGGTNEGAYLLEEGLPEDKNQQDSPLLNMIGSPDRKQIDGPGGTQSITSKVTIVKKSSGGSADVGYTFAQASIDKSLASYKENCGNISPGVGLFTIEKGLIKTREGTTPVRVLSTSTNKTIAADTQTEKDDAVYGGDFTVAGVPGTAAPIRLRFVKPAGTLGSGFLPTGNIANILGVPSFGKVEVSVVDVTDSLVFVEAKDMGMTGLKLPEGVNVDVDKLVLPEVTKGFVTMIIGLIEGYTRSAWETPEIPKMIFVTGAANYMTTEGVSISKGDVNLFSRMMSIQKTHPNCAMTGIICTAATAVVLGSVVNQVPSEGVDTRFIRIGHPNGVLECGIDYGENGAEPVIVNAFGLRTTNLLTDGTTHTR